MVKQIFDASGNRHGSHSIPFIQVDYMYDECGEWASRDVPYKVFLKSGKEIGLSWQDGQRFRQEYNEYLAATMAATEG